MTETEFIKILDAKTALKGSFIGTVINAGDLKSGTSNGRDWTKKVFTIQDDSGDAELVAWGDETTQFSMGHKYEITNPWWKVYEGKTSVTVGKYGNAKVIGAVAEASQPSDTKQEQITPPNQEKIAVKCPHGIAEIPQYVCKKCLVAYYEGLVKEMRDHIGL